MAMPLQPFPFVALAVVITHLSFYLDGTSHDGVRPVCRLAFCGVGGVGESSGLRLRLYYLLIACTLKVSPRATPSSSSHPVAPQPSRQPFSRKSSVSSDEIVLSLPCRRHVQVSPNTPSGGELRVVRSQFGLRCGGTSTHMVRSCLDDPGLG